MPTGIALAILLPLQDSKPPRISYCVKHLMHAGDIALSSRVSGSLSLSSLPSSRVRNFRKARPSHLVSPGCRSLMIGVETVQLVTPMNALKVLHVFSWDFFIHALPKFGQGISFYYVRFKKSCWSQHCSKGCFPKALLNGLLWWGILQCRKHYESLE